MKGFPNAKLHSSIAQKKENGSRGKGTRMLQGFFVMGSNNWKKTKRTGKMEELRKEGT